MSEQVAESKVKGSTAQAYCALINAYEKEFKSWHERGRKIVKRYRDERDGGSKGKRQYNLLYANVDLLKPALYAQAPKPQCERRFRDADQVGRVASDVLERMLTALLDNPSTGFDGSVKRCVEDRLLAGRGQIWLRYKPTFRDITTPLAPEQTGATGQERNDPRGDDPEREVIDQEIETESLIVDYVPWERFGHEVVETWAECNVIWKKVFMSRAELIERFGDTTGRKVALDSHVDEKKPSEEVDKACIYELIDKRAKLTIWLHKDMPNLLDTKNNPLMLETVFPCPSPLFATTSNDSLIPVPDFVYYQDQLEELDDLTLRIRLLTKALRVAGIYDKSQPAVKGLLENASENHLVGVDSWAAFAASGGLKGAMEFLPIEMIAKVVAELIQQRSLVLQQIYEITGLSDIVRGVTKASETLGAQKLKSNYATLRLEVKQKEVASFARDTLRLMAEMACNLFADETIKAMSNVELMTEQEKQAAIQQIQQQSAAAMQSQQPFEVPEGIEEKLQKPSWEEVLGLLRDDNLRGFRIDVETDSTVAIDYEQEKQDRLEFVQSMTGFLAQAVPAVQQTPVIAPVLTAIMLWGARAFKKSRPLEFELENFAKEIEKMAKQGTAPPPEQEQASPPDQSLEIEKVKQQGEDGRTQAKLSLEDRKHNLEEQRFKLEQMRVASEMEARDAPHAEATVNRDSVIVQTESMLQLIQAQASAQQAVSEQIAALLQAVTGVVQGQRQDQETASQQQAATQAMLMAVAQAMQRLGGPKRIITNENGEPVGVEPVEQKVN